ncbi:MAG: hypothetical protein Q8Q28_07660 [Pseudomonadota bacterium]|nr:hypothetical protein [Pseudomonadota bacterium]
MHRAKDSAVDNIADWWGGRLAAVYPGLGGADAQIQVDAEAWNRLRADIALASVDRAVPVVA